MTQPVDRDTWLTYIAQCHFKSIDLGLERIAAVADTLGVSSFTVPIITVGGTNGKGSCVKALTDIYVAAGYRTASYFSPHLLDFNERIVLNGLPVSDDALCAAFCKVESARAGRPLTYFEFVTLAAFWLFQQHAPEVLVLEVGLGGRLDAVNILDPDIAVVTSIGLDHMDWLGHTVEAIAREKAGIFRAKKTAILGPKADMPILRDIAADLRMQCIVAAPTTYNTALPPESVGIAEVVVAQLQSRLPVDPAILAQVFQTSTMPGRFQKISGPVLRVLDVAHNPQGAAWLAAQCQQQLAGKRIYAVWSSFADKDLVGIVTPLRDQIYHWYIAASAEERSASVERLHATLTACQIARITPASSPMAAYHAAVRAAQPGDVILIFGGFAIVGALLSCAMSTLKEVCHG